MRTATLMAGRTTTWVFNLLDDYLPPLTWQERNQIFWQVYDALLEHYGTRAPNANQGGLSESTSVGLAAFEAALKRVRGGIPQPSTK